jgi:hypothetical protein
MLTLLSDIMVVRTWGFGELLIAIVIVAACIGIVIVAVRACGLAIPQWVVQIFWIVLIAVVAIAALRLVLSL